MVLLDEINFMWLKISFYIEVSLNILCKALPDIAKFDFYYRPVIQHTKKCAFFNVLSYLREGSPRHLRSFVLYVKLFSVTGFTWILEVVSYLYPEAETIWKYTDAYNVLFGVLIFIIFICKKSVFKMIMKRCKGMDNSSRFQIPQTMTTAAPTKSQ